MSQNDMQGNADLAPPDVALLNSAAASFAATIGREQCTTTHALCEGQCKLDHGHKGRHECQECGLYFG